MSDAQSGGRKITSPNELEREGFIRIRGRILGNARLGKKAGIAVLAILVLLLVAILYGVTLNKPHVTALRQQFAKPLPPPETSPWWQDQSDAALAVVHKPPTQSTPELSGLPNGVPSLAQPVGKVTGASVVSKPTSAIGTSQSDLASTSAKFPTIPLLEGQSSAPGAVSALPVTERSSAARENPKQVLLQAAMRAPSLIAGALPATAESQSSAAAVNSLSNERKPNGNVPGAWLAASSSFQLKAGTIIPAALITAIDSDLPGLLTAQVRQNVYDTLSGQYLLIPQGSKIVGVYDSHVSYGQERLLVTWTRLVYPDGSSVDLQEMAGADLTGRSGFDAQVDNHTRKLFQGALLLSIIGAGAQLSQPQQSATNGAVPSIGQIIAGSAGGQIASTGTQIVQRQLSVPPNLRVPAGYQFDVIIDHDIAFPRHY